MRCLTLGLLLAAAATPAAEPPLPPLPEAASSLGACVLDGHLYTYGGHVGTTHRYATETTSPRFRRLDLAHPESGWTDLPAGPSLQGLALVAHNKRVIRLGGMRPRNAPGEPADLVSVPTCAAFDPAAGAWQPLPDFPAGRSTFDATVVGDTLVVVGGWGMGGHGKPNVWHDTALLLDLGKPDAKWEAVPQPFRKRAIGAAAVGGKVYAVGGLTAEGESDASVMLFDVATRTWAAGPSLPGPGKHGFAPAVAVSGGRLYAAAMGGAVLRLTQAGDAWEPVGTLATPRTTPRLVATAGGQLIAIGGAGQRGNVAALERFSPPTNP